jgi:hypothetical protein
MKMWRTSLNSLNVRKLVISINLAYMYRIDILKQKGMSYWLWDTNLWALHILMHADSDSWKIVTSSIHFKFSSSWFVCSADATRIVTCDDQNKNVVPKNKDNCMETNTSAVLLTVSLLMYMFHRINKLNHDPSVKWLPKRRDIHMNIQSLKWLLLLPAFVRLTEVLSTIGI